MVVEVRCKHGARRVDVPDPQSQPGRRRVIFDTARLLTYACPQCAYDARAKVADRHDRALLGHATADVAIPAAPPSMHRVVRLGQQEVRLEQAVPV